MFLTENPVKGSEKIFLSVAITVMSRIKGYFTFPGEVHCLKKLYQTIVPYCEEMLWKCLLKRDK